jgi:hypothetical protein
MNLEYLNETCACMPIDPSKVAHTIAGASLELQNSLAQRPVMFAGSPVFISPSDLAEMQTLVSSIERVLHSAEFEEILQQRSKDRHKAFAQKFCRGGSTPGLFMGYDFHMTREGPRLIEINTNAGGAFIVQNLYNSLSNMPLCGGNWGGPTDPAWMYNMLIREWQHAGRHGIPQTLAIVDEAPKTQFLHPDFVLARRYFEDYGIQVYVADPAEMKIQHGDLTLQGETIDLVYNRLTDFYFDNPAHRELRDAWMSNAVVVSPSPAHHARFADKRNLVLLSTHQHLLRKDLPETDTILRTIPQTWLVTADNAAHLWRNRKGLFFKPADGFAGRGAYRGAKLTRRVWADILSRKDGSYVAQEQVQAPARWIDASGMALKYDVRAFSYDGEIKLLAARVYQGQTTNFRTPGGGFAPVVLLGNDTSKSLL